MVDTRGEVDFRWLERVVGGKMDGEEEDPPGVRAVTLRLDVSWWEGIVLLGPAILARCIQAFWRWSSLQVP